MSLEKLKKFLKKYRAQILVAALTILLLPCCCLGIATFSSKEASTPTATVEPSPTTTLTRTNTPIPQVATVEPSQVPPSVTPTKVDTQVPPTETVEPSPTLPTATVEPSPVPLIATAEPSPTTVTLQVWDCPNSTEGAMFVASRKSDKFHKLGCQHANRIKPENRVCFATREVAIANGYNPCGTCKP